MQELLLFGGGRSSYFLIDYLLRHARDGDWRLTVADAKPQSVETHFAPHDRLAISRMNIYQDDDRRRLIRQADLVLSLLPPSLHPLVAADCVDIGRNMMTASYVSPEIDRMDGDLRRKGLFFLMETGFDPGMDHLSAMQEIDALRDAGCTLESFRSYAGGLMNEPASQNPWGYRVSWSPLNIVHAGKEGARYRLLGHEKFVPYARIFQEIHEVNIPGLGPLEAYCNRNALQYLRPYRITDIPTMVRYTLRRPGFCRGWDQMVHLGMTRDHIRFEGLQHETYRDFTARMTPMLPEAFEAAMQERKQQPEDRFPHQLEALGLMSAAPLQVDTASPANVLGRALIEHLSMRPQDRDLTVMLHRMGYRDAQGVRRERRVVLMQQGDDPVRTAMARCVGWPLAIAARLYLQKKFRPIGIQIPVERTLYEPVMAELKQLGLSFHSEDRPLDTTETSS